MSAGHRDYRSNPGPEWRIYYDDGTTYSSQEGPPQEAPCLGIQAIVQRCPERGKYVVTRFDFYWYDEEEAQWFGGDWFGLVDWLMRTGRLHAGRFIPNQQYDAIVRRAQDDPDFPATGSWRIDKGNG